jgi:hypothetical protein
MVYTKKTNPVAFGEILAGLGAGADRQASDGQGAGRASPRGASPRDGAETVSGMDISWIQTARMRASAAQMAQRVAAAPAEPKQTDAGDRPHRNVEDSIETWPSAAPDPSPGSAEPHPGDADMREGANRAGLTGAAMPGSRRESVERPSPVPAAAVRPNPVHALWRLLGQIPGGWRAGAGAVASTLAAVRSAREKASAGKPAARNPKPEAASPQKSEDETIAEELGLRADLAIVDLRRIRRDFAKKNHPDRFEPAQRLGAARRMTIANMLIDARLKQRPPSL